MRRKRLLVLSFYPCFFPPRSGGETRLYNLYHALADRFDIRILSSSHVDAGVDRVVHAPFLVEHRYGKAAPFVECYRAAAAIGGGPASGAGSPGSASAGPGAPADGRTDAGTIDMALASLAARGGMCEINWAPDALRIH